MEGRVCELVRGCGTMVFLMYHNLSCTQSTVVCRVYHYFNAVLFAAHKNRMRTTYLIELFLPYCPIYYAQTPAFGI